MMSDRLVGEKILTITSPKAVGKKRDAGKEAEAEAPQLFMTMNAKMYSLERFQEDFRDVTVKEVDFLNDLEVSNLYHCDGLVLCVAKDKEEEPKLVLWNPCLCQTRWIEPREDFNVQDKHAIGYSDDSDSRNHKILRFTRNEGYEIYEIKSNSWRVLSRESPTFSIDFNQRGVPVKGNTYFFAEDFIIDIYGWSRGEIFLICFDFTNERFGPPLPLPFNDYFDSYRGDTVTLSTFLRGDDEQLAVLFGGFETDFFEIWVTLTVEPNRASWSKFLRVKTEPFATFGFELCTSRSGGTFFVDEEKKMAVLFEVYEPVRTKTHNAFVFGEEGLKSSVKLGEAILFQDRNRFTNNIIISTHPPLVCSSPYRPSLVQVDHPRNKRKRVINC